MCFKPSSGFKTLMLPYVLRKLLYHLSGLCSLNRRHVLSSRWQLVIWDDLTERHVPGGTTNRARSYTKIRFWSKLWFLFKDTLSCWLLGSRIKPTTLVSAEPQCTPRNNRYWAFKHSLLCSYQTFRCFKSPHSMHYKHCAPVFAAIRLFTVVERTQRYEMETAQSEN